MDRRVLAMIYRGLESPELWEFSQYRATWAARGIDVWIGNSRWGMSVNVGAMKYGGQNPFYWLLPWQWWRFRLLHTVRRVSVEKILAKEREEAAKIAFLALVNS